MRSKSIVAALFALLIAPAAAFAQSGQPDPNAGGDNSADETSQAPNRDSDAADEELSSEDAGNDVGGPLPASKSDDDVAPPVASPGTPAGMVVRQAGIGGQVGYGRAGVLELGGSAGFTAAPSFTSVTLAPEVGWFVADNLELSARVAFTHIKTDMDSGTLTTALIEPSYHLPFTRSAFAFLGMGMGAAYVSGPGLGFAVAPRLGANFMIGRSGVLTPSLSYQYTTHDSAMVGENATLLVVSSAVSANVGYTVMW